MIDKHTAGLRGNHLRIAHEEYDLVAEDVAKLLNTAFKADKYCGNDQELSKRIVVLDENEMFHIMCGFRNLKAISWETAAVYVSVLLQGKHFVFVNVKFPESLFEDTFGIYKNLINIRHFLSEESIPLHISYVLSLHGYQGSGQDLLPGVPLLIFMLPFVLHSRLHPFMTQLTD